jgi:Arc/MetJ family transcription regulator
MKMTLHIDEALLERVMAGTGVPTKRHAIDLALREMDRRIRLAHLAAEGLGLPSDALKEVVDPAYNLESMRTLDRPVTYDRRRNSGR